MGETTANKGTELTSLHKLLPLCVTSFSCHSQTVKFRKRKQRYFLYLTVSTAKPLSCVIINCSEKGTGSLRVGQQSSKIIQQEQPRRQFWLKAPQRWADPPATTPKTGRQEQVGTLVWIRHFGRDYCLLKSQPGIRFLSLCWWPAMNWWVSFPLWASVYTLSK